MAGRPRCGRKRSLMQHGRPSRALDHLPKLCPPFSTTLFVLAGVCLQRLLPPRWFEILKE